MRLASESAEEEETRLSGRRGRDRASRAAQATKICRGSETAEAREQRSKKEASRFRKRAGAERSNCVVDMRCIFPEKQAGYRR